MHNLWKDLGGMGFEKSSRKSRINFGKKFLVKTILITFINIREGVTWV